MLDRFWTNLGIEKRLSRWAAPIALFVITFFSYGIFAYQQGFHWDDWGFVWLIRTLGKPGLFDYFATNRPFLAYVYSVTTSIFGTNPWAWQLFSIFFRWLSAVSLLWMLRIIWPKYKQQIFIISILFLIYPGFNQQAISITYGHFFLAQTLLFISIGLMLKFASDPRRLWWAGVLGVCLSAFNLFSTEYFVGLELLRPLLLWYGLREQFPNWRSRLKRATQTYGPFFLTLLGYLYWRYFILGFYLYQLKLVSDLESAPIGWLATLPKSIWDQWQVAFLQAWSQIFQVPNFDEYGSRLTVIYILVLVLTGIGLYKIANQFIKSQETDWRFSARFFGLGLLSLFLAGLPFLITELPIRLTFPNSRFTLPFALGSALILIAILELLPHSTLKILIASGLIALAVGVQFNNGYLWREDWRLQKSYFWQMIWRIPELQPNSILLSSDTPLMYSSDNSLTFPLNLIYAPDNHSTDIQYVYYHLSVRLGNELQAIKPGLPIQQDYLAATFDSTSDQIVAVHFSPPGCFRVLHPVFDRDLPLAPASGEIAEQWLKSGVPVLPRTAAKAIQISNLNQINPNPTIDVVLPPIFGSEPTHTWCYYFEKADLARQEDDWVKVAEIGDQVFGIPYYPDNLSEYLPFVEAYARTGRWEEARDLTRKTADQVPLLAPALCAIWQRVEKGASTNITPAQINKMKNELGYCPFGLGN